MSLDHADTAFTIEPATARALIERATPKGRRLLVLFAREQLLRLDDLKKEFGTSQNGLNALLGRLTRDFQELQGREGFYIHLPHVDGGSWAIGHTSGVHLRKAIREDERSRQKRIDFPARK